MPELESPDDPAPLGFERFFETEHERLLRRSFRPAALRIRLSASSSECG
jgi:hypothetical protein